MIEEWIKKYFSKKKKTYIHFDINKNIKDSQKFTFFENLFDVENISKHNFWPLIRITWFKNKIEKDIFTSDGKFIIKYKKFKKPRPISYASHLDSKIYSYYSFMLEKNYESYLNWLSINNSVIAYRKKWNGKNNIQLAKNAFEEILKLKNCVVLWLDVKWFFDNLDHKILKKNLELILDIPRLEDDWYKVFASITKFSYISSRDLYKYWLIKNNKHPWFIDYELFNTKKRELKERWIKLVKLNDQFEKRRWIPQWLPISWLLANIYMKDFDIFADELCKEHNWRYFRYSDDILFILERNTEIKLWDIFAEIHSFLSKNLKLEFSEEKTEISIFKDWKLIKGAIGNIKNWLWKKSDFMNYLWFSFNWEKIYIKNSTLSNYYKKLSQSFKRLSYLNKNKTYKWHKINIGSFNRKYIFNWNFKWNKYIKWKHQYSLATDSDNYYFWFISYWYFAAKEFEELFQKLWIKNSIKTQLASHKKIYKKFKNKYIW